MADDSTPITDAIGPPAEPLIIAEEVEDPCHEFGHGDGEANEEISQVSSASPAVSSTVDSGPHPGNGGSVGVGIGVLKVGLVFDVNDHEHDPPNSANDGLDSKVNSGVSVGFGVDCD